jgi:glycine/D-amino acid oxidase-like deaminating enzyme
LEPHLRALADSKFACFWLDQDARPPRQGALRGEQRCELLIVGGGLTGMWAAVQARERRPDLDILLIEATEIGDGASGRNGGFLSDSLSHGEINAGYHFPGEEEKLTELGRQNLRELLASLERYQIDARYEATGFLDVFTEAAQTAGMAEVAERQRQAGEDVVWFDRDAMRAEINSPTYMGGLWNRGHQIGLVDPAYLCWGLKKTLLSLGVRVHEGTRMLRMEPEGDGMRVACADGSIRCQKLLLATNAFPNPVGTARRSIIPVWDYALATEPLSDAQRQSIGWKRRQGLANKANMFHYYRLSHDNRITWGGGTSVRYYYRGRIDAGVSDVRERMQKLSADFFHTFPQLEGVRFSHRWSGIIASTTRFCLAPGAAYGGRVAWSIGYTGQGVSATRFGARVGLELLGYDPSELLALALVRKKSRAWPPEPLRWLGVTLTRKEMERADRNGGKRSLWLKLLDRVGLGFAC